MALVLLKPFWFQGYDILLEILFAIIALLVAYYANKINKIAQTHESKLFAEGFFFITASYILLAIINFAAIFALKTASIKSPVRISDLITLGEFGTVVSISLFLIGIITLAYMTLHYRNKRIPILMIIPLLIALLLSHNKLFLFYIITAFLLVYITIYYIQHYLKHKNLNTLLILLAFLLMFIAKVHFIISLSEPLFYAIGHLFEFLGYGLILISLVRVIKQ